MKKQSEKKLAKELAARLDAGVLEPDDADGAELQDLMAIYACLEDVVEEPHPSLRRWVKRSLEEGSFRERAAAWVGRLRERYLSWLPRRYHPALAGAAAVLIALLLLVSIPSPLGRPDQVVGYQDGVLYNAANVEPSSEGRVRAAVDASTAPSEGAVTESADDDGVTWAYDSLGRRVASGEAAEANYDGMVVIGTDDTAGEAQAGYAAPADTPGNVQFAWPESLGGEEGRMIVRRASMAFVVQDAAASFARVEEIATDQGGGVFSLETGKTAQGSMQTFVSIQVPVEACNDTLAQLRALDAELIAERVTSQDVTAEYVDLAARARNLELAEAEIQQLLESAEERGEKSKEILNIYDELTDIRERIERLKGQMILLEHSAAMARIDVALIPEEIAPEPPEPRGFDAGHVLRQAWEEVVHIFEDIATFFIRAFAYAPLTLPPLLVVGLVAWLVVRRVRRNAAAGGEADEA